MNIDTVFINGKILTLDYYNRRAGSLAVSNGKIIGIWDTAEPPRGSIDVSEKTDIINLKGATLLPGFIDTHNHILMYALRQFQVDCSSPKRKSIEDILSAIGKKVQETPQGEWIEGVGYDDTALIENRHPTKQDLDQVSPNHPVLLTHISSHLAVANSVALSQANLDKGVFDPSDGHFGRDEDGELNGVLYEWGAMNPVKNLIPQKTIEELVDALGNAADDYLQQGITTNTDAAIGLVFGHDESVVHLKAALQRKNPMRTRLMILHDLLREGAAFAGHTPDDLNQLFLQQSDGLVKFDGAKMFQDGSIQGLTGALREPYFQHPDLFGDLIHDEDEFKREILDLHKKGFRITVHGNGDRAIGSILDAYDHALQKIPKYNHRHRIEHVQTAQSYDLQRMQDLQVAGSFFINHIYYWGDRHEKIFLGPERAERMNPLAEAVDKDLLFTIHSDCPVTPISPLFSIWAAVNRLTSSGKVLGSDQRIDVVTALKSMTVYGAALNFEENETGTLEVGKNADMIILEEDPTQVNPKDIKDLKVLSTFINGKAVYGQSSLVTS